MKKLKFFKFKCILVALIVLFSTTAFAAPGDFAKIAEEHIHGEYCNHTLDNEMHQWTYEQGEMREADEDTKRMLVESGIIEPHEAEFLWMGEVVELDEDTKRMLIESGVITESDIVMSSGSLGTCGEMVTVGLKKVACGKSLSLGVASMSVFDESHRYGILWLFVCNYKISKSLTYISCSDKHIAGSVVDNIEYNHSCGK